MCILFNFLCVKFQYDCASSLCQLMFMLPLYIGWQWRNFVIPIYASCSGRHDVVQRNVNILQHFTFKCRSGASTKLFLNRLIQFHLNSLTLTDLHQLTSQSATLCPTTWKSYCYHRLLLAVWRSGSALILINGVNLCWARLVLGWVTVWVPLPAAAPYFQYAASQLGRLSLLPSVVGW